MKYCTELGFSVVGHEYVLTWLTTEPLVLVSLRCLLENVQDSLLEITLRSRVVEKLSVALDVCLFATQYGREACPGINEDGTLQVSLGFRLATMNTGHQRRHNSSLSLAGGTV